MILIVLGPQGALTYFAILIIKAVPIVVKVMVHNAWWRSAVEIFQSPIVYEPNLSFHFKVFSVETTGENDIQIHLIFSFQKLWNGSRMQLLKTTKVNFSLIEKVCYRISYLRYRSPFHFETVMEN